MTNRFDSLYLQCISERRFLPLALAGALALSPGQSSAEPLGASLNNPGNIRTTSDHWKGSSRDNREFVKFDQPVYGIRAVTKLLKTYKQKYGLNTIRGIITRWAPPEENDTEKYIRNMVEYTGFGETDPLYLFDSKGKPNRDRIIKIVRGIMINEIGKEASSKYQDSLIGRAINL